MNKNSFFSISGLILLGACGGALETSSTGSDSFINVPDQQLSSYSRVSLDRVFLDEPGFLVIHQQDYFGRFGEVLGAEVFETGNYREPIIVLDSPVSIESGTEYGDVLSAVAYRDVNGNGVFERAIDAVMLDEFGNTVSQNFSVGDDATTFHVNLSIVFEKGIGYQWQIVEDDLGGFDFDNGDITLIEGMRYAIENTSASTHPIAFTDINGDVVQHQPNSSNGFYYFTVTAAFADSVVGYTSLNNQQLGGDVFIQVER